MARVLMPLPDAGFDPTEAAVPWRLLRDAGHEVAIASERGGEPPEADRVQLDGPLFGRYFGAARAVRDAYRALEAAPAFRAPLAWGDADPDGFDGLVLPGGHADGMRQYLGSETVQALAAGFLRAGRPVGAICHGVLVLARARDPETGRSPLAARRTTCFPKYLERLAAAGLAWKRGYSVRPYAAYVEDEVRAALDDPSRQLALGPPIMLRRDTPGDTRPAFVVRDGSLVTARWLGDAHRFAQTFAGLLG